MKKKIKPLGSRIVVERIEAVKTKGGIFLPETAKEKPKQGKVVAVGPGHVNDKGKNYPVELEVGDEILFSSYAGTEYKSDEGEFLIMNEDDVLAIVK